MLRLYWKVIVVKVHVCTHHQLIFICIQLSLNRQLTCRVFVVNAWEYTWIIVVAVNRVRLCMVVGYNNNSSSIRRYKIRSLSWDEHYYILFLCNLWCDVWYYLLLFVIFLCVAYIFFVIYEIKKKVGCKKLQIVQHRERHIIYIKRQRHRSVSLLIW